MAASHCTVVHTGQGVAGLGSDSGDGRRTEAATRAVAAMAQRRRSRQKADRNMTTGGPGEHAG